MRDAETFADLGGRIDHREPVGGAFGEQSKHLGLGADVDAAARLVQQDHLRVGGQHLADHDLLLIAAGERPDRRAAAGGLDMNIADRIVDQRLLAPARQQQTANESGDAGQRQVGADRHCLHESVALAILGRKRQTGGDPIGDAQARNVGAFEPYAAASQRHATRDRLQKLGAPRSHQAIDADNLAGAHI
jgi:hypothetical protein